MYEMLTHQLFLQLLLAKIDPLSLCFRPEKNLLLY